MTDEMKIQIEHIVSNFEWLETWKFMKASGWTWYFGAGEPLRVPTVEELKSSGVELLTNVANGREEKLVHCSGGFYALKINGNIGLFFGFGETGIFVQPKQEGVNEASV